MRPYIERGCMSQETWDVVDRYFADHLVKPDSALEAALKSSNEAGLPAINVSPTQGKLLHLLAKIKGARKILEIGTLGGYSTIWLARALPSDGQLVTLEADPKHAEVAQANIERAGLSGIVEVRLGRALDTLPQLQAENQGPFDLVFVDADKPSNPDYFEWALKLTRQGSVLIFDNVVRHGAVIEDTRDDPGIQGTRRLIELLSIDPRVDATAIQTVGVKGYDGFAIALVV
jgi:predicted O-methyltransferase YrrM